MRAAAAALAQGACNQGRGVLRGVGRHRSLGARTGVGVSGCDIGDFAGKEAASSGHLHGGITW
jgi:hypothetical protein